MDDSANEKSAGTGLFLDVEAAVPALKGGGCRGGVRSALELLLGIRKAREIFSRSAREENPAEALLTGFGLEPDAVGVVEAIPAQGGVLVVANHPFGGADALVLIALCLRKRPDFLILANEVAASAPGIGRWALPLSILGDRDGARRNARTLRAALDHLRSGGLLAVFPAGEVSTWREGWGSVADGPWSRHIAALAGKAAVPALPVRFFGKNPWHFHAAGAVHPFLRTTLLPRMLLGRRGEPVVCRAGGLLDPESLVEAEDPTALLRAAVDGVPVP